MILECWQLQRNGKDLLIGRLVLAATEVKGVPLSGRILRAQFSHFMFFIFHVTISDVVKNESFPKKLDKYVQRLSRMETTVSSPLECTTRRADLRVIKDYHILERAISLSLIICASQCAPMRGNIGMLLQGSHASWRKYSPDID